MLKFISNLTLKQPLETRWQNKFKVIYFIDWEKFCRRATKILASASKDLFEATTDLHLTLFHFFHFSNNPTSHIRRKYSNLQLSLLPFFPTSLFKIFFSDPPCFKVAIIGGHLFFILFHSNFFYLIKNLFICNFIYTSLRFFCRR